jgi:hypothetical protein
MAAPSLTRASTYSVTRLLSSPATKRGEMPRPAATRVAIRSASRLIPSSEVCLPGRRTTQSLSPKRTR